MHNKRVLVIDENSNYRSRVTIVLRRNYLVSVATGGAEGFFKAIEFPPDVVLLEVMMEGWSGLRTLQAFRGHAALKHIPVVMVSSDASRATVMAAIEAGADDYVLKTPMHFEELPQKIARLLDRTHVPERRADVPLPASHLGQAPSLASQPESRDQQAILDSWE